MDFRALDRKAEELRAAGAELAAKGELVAEERDKLMKIMGQLEELDRQRIEARDAEIEETRSIAERGVTIGETADHKAADAFRSYIKSGAEDRTALVAGTGANGGYVVPEPVHGPLMEKFRKLSPLMEDATIFQVNNNSKMYLPYKSAHGAVTNATETGSRTEQTEPTFTNVVLNTYDYYTDQRASQQFLDSVDGAENLITEWIYADFIEQFQSDLAQGDGTTKANGIYKGDSYFRTSLSGSAGALTNSSFLTAYFNLPQRYMANAKWYMSPATLSTAMAFAYPNLNNTPLVQYDGVRGTYTILGKPVVMVDDAPAIGASNFPVAVGDLSLSLAVGIHKEATILRDPYTATPNVRWYGVARMGSAFWNPNSLVLLKSNNS